MNLAKAFIVLNYVLLVALYFFMPNTLIAQAALWLLVVLAVVHVLEFVLLYRFFVAEKGAMSRHFFHTLLFGFVYWLPLKRKATKS